MAARDAQALAAFIEDREGWTFGYGRGDREHDCARFVAAGVAVATGDDPLARFGESWTSKRAALAILRRHGGLNAAVSEVLPEVAPTFARRGDVGMTADGALVLFEGDTVVGVGPDGLRRLGRDSVVRAWSVACPS